MPVYLRPQPLERTRGALARQPHLLLGGGTRQCPARVGRPLDDHVAHLPVLATRRRIAERGGHWPTGALPPWRRKGGRG